MGALLESGMVGNIGLKHLRVIKEDTLKKWDDLGFLEGLDGHQKDNIAQLYENQASYLINEAAVSDASGSFETVVFPIIRRVFSKLLANDIVSVQAMNMPIGKLFYFVPQTSSRLDGSNNAGNDYTQNQPGSDVYATTYSAHTSMGYDGIPSCVKASAGSCVVTPFLAKNLYDLFYDDGLFDNSKGTLTIRTMDNVPVFTGTGAGGYNRVAAVSTAVVGPVAADFGDVTMDFKQDV